MRNKYPNAIGIKLFLNTLLGDSKMVARGRKQKASLL
jgi:hypothetical protein